MQMKCVYGICVTGEKARCDCGRRNFSSSVHRSPTSPPPLHRCLGVIPLSLQSAHLNYTSSEKWIAKGEQRDPTAQFSQTLASTNSACTMRTSFAQQHRLPPLLPSTFRMRSTCTSFVFSVGLCVFGHGFLFNPLPHSNPPNIYIYIFIYTFCLWLFGSCATTWCYITTPSRFTHNSPRPQAHSKCRCSTDSSISSSYNCDTK